MKLGKYTYKYPDVLINEDSGQMYNINACIEYGDIDKELVTDLHEAIKEAFYIILELEEL